ncbi:S-layer homology domain-containing protein [Sporosarcina sp. E16_8]|uniref:S-layer homology domain-containing protein n=1 Tax=Sporosarcina sp. E16_8 TaxID=2789295 RepID=UPI001A915C27|nr:S-layer homology domain-containing protein [Sporosarcina sp. E16_8]MBO0589736.1 S-layer homology domain-containing protein [Sporosarcina sp. E16_8]
MKKVFKIFTMLVVLLILIPTSSAFAFYNYSDVDKSSSHYEALDFLQKKGLIGGYRFDKEIFHFRPNHPIKRTEAATIFFRILDFDVPEDYEEIIKKYKDIDSTHPLIIPIAASIDKGIFIGEDGFFKDGELNREQMATTIIRAFDLKHNSGSTVKVNLENVSNSHKTSVATLAQYGITTELADFRPKENVTRAQFISFVYRTMKLKGIEQYINFESGGKTPPYNSELYISTHIFHESEYVYSNQIHKSVFTNTNMTIEEAKNGAEYAVAFPNTPILTKYALIRHDSLKGDLIYLIINTDNYAEKLITYDISEPDEVPLPDGKTIEQIEINQKENMDMLEKKYNFKMQYGGNMLSKDRNHRIKSMAEIMNKEPEEVVVIINWVIETGNVYDGGGFLVYYEFDSGRIPHFKVEEK